MTKERAQRDFYGYCQDFLLVVGEDKSCGESLGAAEKDLKDKNNSSSMSNEVSYTNELWPIEELMIICNKILTAKRIPKAWKSSTTTLIFKGGDNKSNPLGYRPIAILSCAYKGGDTTEAVTKLFACTNNALSTDKNIHITLLDIAKAYDSVEFSYGLTDEISIEADLRQGDIISPPLYHLFINPLIEWLEKNKSPYRLVSLLVNLIAYADDLTLVAASGEGMEEAMKKVNDFCTHNNITINKNKSSYHWLRGEPGDIKTRGTDIRKEGADGLFTILGWTTNLKMNWDEQIELLIQRFMSITNRALAEKKLTLNQKVEVINTIGLSTISYRAQHTMTDRGEWLIELDRWTMKKLNSATFLEEI
ncbi:hypothetical protein PROFUN_04856 [Planoprotostelium fungivorum]|uniref:Reverse transcriptase domain-containing protein n=1 Tax=Planoprotostelium fungivorum TaxID=1890364 RepID=A0A2P6NF41_9EUKA|nr:hypothetical protein PROFUN_04856 [Planoprotostelium fungivorum]